MSTNCTIWRQIEDGSFKGIYCHFDGYLNGVGEELFKCYQDPEKVKTLIELGDISYLDDEVDCPEGHTFDHPALGRTVAYHRDRNEPMHNFYAQDLEDAIDNGHNFYQYIYINNKWMTCTDYDIDTLRELTEKDFE